VFLSSVHITSRTPGYQRGRSRGKEGSCRTGRESASDATLFIKQKQAERRNEHHNLSIERPNNRAKKETGRKQAEGEEFIVPSSVLLDSQKSQNNRRENII